MLDPRAKLGWRPVIGAMIALAMLWAVVGSDDVPEEAVLAATLAVAVLLGF